MTYTDASSRETSRKIFLWGHILTAGGICTVSPQSLCVTSDWPSQNTWALSGKSNVFKRTCTGYLEESLLKPSWSATSNYRKTFSANWCEACHYKLIVTWSFKYTRQICNYSWLQTLILNIPKFKNTALLAFKQHLPFKPLRSKLYIGSLITEEEEWFSASIILSRAGRL